MSSRLALRLALLGLALTSMAPARAEAQDDVQTAARAFEAGQQAQLRGDFSEAAELFELAYASAPSPAALRSAIRAHRAAGERPRAATLALMGIVRYASDAPTRDLAQQTLGDLEPELARVTLRCSVPCVASVDGSLVSTDPATELTFFVEPGPHDVGAGWPNRPDVSQPIAPAAGTATTLDATAPEPEPEPELDLEPEPEQTTAPQGLHPWAFYTSLGVTGALTAVTIWSAVDLAGKVDDYENDPTEQGYDDGVRAQRLTYSLAWISGAGIIATALIGALWTDWSGEEASARYLPGFWAGTDGGGVTLLHSF